MKNLQRDNGMTTEERTLRANLKYAQNDLAQAERGVIRAIKLGMDGSDLEDFIERVRKTSAEVARREENIEEAGF